LSYSTNSLPKGVYDRGLEPPRELHQFVVRTGASGAGENRDSVLAIQDTGQFRHLRIRGCDDGCRWREMQTQFRVDGIFQGDIARQRDNRDALACDGGLDGDLEDTWCLFGL
jgi:hypothetical protein